MDYYQRKIAVWMDGTESLTDGEYRVYDVIVNLIYLNNGPIVHHEAGLAGRCKQHPLAFRKNLKGLVAKGKLHFDAEGKITNKKAIEVIGRFSGRKAKPPANPPPVQGGVDRGSSGGDAAKPLKNNNTKGDASSLERKKDSEGAKAPSAPAEKLDPRTRLFRDGLEIIERISGRPKGSCRSLLGRWLRSRDDDPIPVLRVIEDAERERVVDPVPWIERALGTRSKPRETKNGFAAVAMSFMTEESDNASDDEPAARGGPVSAGAGPRTLAASPRRRDE